MDVPHELYARIGQGQAEIARHPADARRRPRKPVRWCRINGPRIRAKARKTEEILWFEGKQMAGLETRWRRRGDPSPHRTTAQIQQSGLQRLGLGQRRQSAANSSPAGYGAANSTAKPAMAATVNMP